MNKTALVMIAISLCVPTVAFSADQLPQGGAISTLQNEVTSLQTQVTNVQNQVNNIQLIPGPPGPQGAVGPAGPAGPAGATGATGPAGPPGILNGASVLRQGVITWFDPTGQDGYTTYYSNSSTITVTPCGCATVTSGVECGFNVHFMNAFTQPNGPTCTVSYYQGQPSYITLFSRPIEAPQWSPYANCTGGSTDTNDILITVLTSHSGCPQIGSTPSAYNCLGNYAVSFICVQ